MDILVVVFSHIHLSVTPGGSSIYGIFQARAMVWVAIITHFTIIVKIDIFDFILNILYLYFFQYF